VRSGEARACGEAIRARIDPIPAAVDGFDPLHRASMVSPDDLSIGAGSGPCIEPGAACLCVRPGGSSSRRFD